MKYTEIVAVLQQNYRALVRSWKRRGTTGASLGCIRQNISTAGLVGPITPIVFSAALTDAIISARVKGFEVISYGES